MLLSSLRSNSQFLASPPGGRTTPWLLLAFIALSTLILAVLMVRMPLFLSGAMAVALSIFILSFVRAEAGLYVVVFAMLLSPEIGTGSLSSSSATTASRGITIRAEDLLLVILGFAWLAHMAVHKELGLVRRTPLNGPIAGYIVACLFSTAIGLFTGRVNGLTSFFYVLKYIEYFVVYFIVANYLHHRVQIQRFAIALLATALIVSVVAMAQIPSGARVSAPFEGERGEPNTLGGYLLFTGALAAGLMFHAPSARLRYLLAGLLAIMVVPFLATLSRGSYLALPFVYLAFVALRPGKRVAMIVLWVGMAVVGTLAMPQEVKERILYTFEQQTQAKRVEIGGVKLDTSTSARLESWRQALADAMDSPLWGFGVTGYGFLDAQYPRLLVETGLLGLSLFAVLIGAVFKEALRAFRQATDPLYRGLAMGLIAGLVGLLVHGIGANTFIIVRIMEPFWFTVGLVVCSRRLESGEQA